MRHRILRRALLGVAATLLALAAGPPGNRVRLQTRPHALPPLYGVECKKIPECHGCRDHKLHTAG